MDKSALQALAKKDFMSRDELESIQLARLKRVVSHAYKNQALFRSRMQEKGLDDTCIKEMKDIQKLPFFKKVDLRDTYPFGLLSVPMENIIRLQASSGTTGSPIVIAYTKEDVACWQEATMRALMIAGIGSGDVIQNAYGYGLFTGGMGLHYGAEGLGATVLPISSGNTERQIKLMSDFGVTCISCTPSYFLHIIEKAKQLGYDFKKMKLRNGIFGAEPWTNEMRERIEKESGIKAWDIYGLTEISGPGVAMDCPARTGLHMFEDLYYPEIIDPETGEALPDGTEGELVITTLHKFGMPMIRYRTRDISVIVKGTCECGRTIRRIKRIDHRNDDMLIIRGVNVFPSQIEAALLTIPGVQPHYHIIVRRHGDLDTLEVQVELSAELFGDTIRSIEVIQKKIGNAIKSIIGLAVTVTPVEPGSLERSMGKAKRVTDLRNK